MAKATWQGKTLAQGATVLVEGNHYFDPKDVRMASLNETAHHTTCPWKGLASYYDVRVDGATNPNAAWTYHDPKPEAERLGIRDRIAFWKGVRVED